MSFERFLCVAALFCFASLGASSLHAQADELAWPQWQHVGGDFGSATAIYFIDPLHGVAAASGRIYHTYPPQHQWRQSTMPSGIGSGGVVVSTIRSIQGKLYAASHGSDVLVSTDSGQSWQFSGLGLTNANDVYADGSGKIRALTDPMTRFARIDTQHCVATGNGSIYTSSDGGLNWNSVVTGIDPVITGAFGDPCNHVFICPSPTETEVLRSTDSGKTWHSVPTGSYAFPQFIYGASSVTYASDLYGMYRSSDDGITWTQIITVTGGPHVMAVWGPMGEHAALSYNGGIWMTTAGGDDKLHSGVNMTDSNGMPLMQDDTFNVPYKVVSTCNAFTIGLPFQSDVSGLSEKVSILKCNHPEDFAIVGPDTIMLPKGPNRWLNLGYDPHHPFDTVVLQFDNHWQCSDWSETRTVIVIAYRLAQIVPPPPLEGNCHPVTEAAFMKLDSCQTVIIDSINIPSYLLSRLHFIAPLPDTVRLGFGDSLFFTFDPTDTIANILDSVKIFAHLPGMDSALAWWDYRSALSTDPPPYPSLTDINQSIPVNLIALPNTPTLATRTPSLDLGKRYICDERDTFVVIRNAGCAGKVCVSDVKISPSGFIITRGGGSFCLDPGKSDTVWLHTQIDTTGGLTANTATITVTSDAQTPLAPITLTRKIVYPTQWNLSLSAPDSCNAGESVVYKILQHGSFSAGDTSLDLKLIFNDDMLHLSSIDEASVSQTGYYRDAAGFAHYTLHISPVTANPILATLHLSAYQTRAATTTIALDSIHTSPNDISVAPGCITTLSLESSEFSIRYSCNSPLLSEALSGRLIIDGIQPNPASDEVRISYSNLTNESTSATLTIEDILGRTVIQKAIVLNVGISNYDMLTVTDLPSGAYLIRLSALGYRSSRRFVKE